MESKAPHASSDASPVAAQRVGLKHLVEPRIGPIDQATARFVHDLLAAHSGTEANRFCSVELSVKDGKLDVGAAAKPICKMAGSDQASARFLGSKETEALRRQVPGIVAELLRLTGQAGYLVDNADALFGKGWRIVVDLDSYQRRSAKVGFHKDSMGRTLFTALAYLVEGDPEDTFLGPEYIVNPPVIMDHLAYISGTLPEVFFEDLALEVDTQPEASVIQYATVPNAGFVGMLDEMVHHSTPFPRSRNAGYSWDRLERKDVFRTALQQHVGAEAARQFFEAAYPRQLGGNLPKPYRTRQEFDAVKADFHAAALRLAALPARFQPHELRSAVATDALFEAIFEQAELVGDVPMGVAIHHSPNNDQSQGEHLRRPLPPLMRQISKDLSDNKPLPKSPPLRPFVRLWVMAIPRT